jgi:hypothetical protein
MLTETRDERDARFNAESAIKSILTNPHGENAFGMEFEEYFGLQYPNPFHVISATFQKVKGRPDIIRIRTTFWRAENEVWDAYPIEDARAFYRKLVEAGFRPF